MDEKKEYYELLNAYAFGCLDAEEITKLKEYIAGGGDFPWQELGEFQNLSSLLPSILEIETPRPEVKDAVARKLYRIKSEIKAKRDKQKKEKSPPPTEGENLPEEKIQQDSVADPEKTKAEKAKEEFELVKPSRRTSEVQEDNDLTEYPERKITAEDEIDTMSDYENEERLNKEEEIPEEKSQLIREQKDVSEEKKKSISSLIFVVVLLVLIVAMVFAYFNFSSKVKDYESKIDSLNNQITRLSEKFNKNRELEIVLNSQNLKTVNLKGTKLAENSFGKLFIDSDTQKGFLQVSDLPPVKGNNIYQVWIKISEDYFSLAKFGNTDKFNYVPFELPPINTKKKLIFLVTREAITGSEKPGDEIYLTGSM